MPLNKETKPNKTIWTGNITELTELIYAGAKLFSNKK